MVDSRLCEYWMGNNYFIPCVSETSLQLKESLSSVFNFVSTYSHGCTCDGDITYINNVVVMVVERMVVVVVLK